MSRTDDSQSNIEDGNISVELLPVYPIVDKSYKNAKLDSFGTVEQQKQSTGLDCDGKGDEDIKITGTVDNSDNVPPNNHVMVLVYKYGRWELV